MRLLLDTHVWLWLQTSPNRLHPSVVSGLTDAEHELLLSTASIWEVAIKYSIGKLPLPIPPAQYVPDRMRANGVAALPVAPAHALAVADLPFHHRDPFDRMLVAQAVVDHLTLVTVDRALEPYAVRTVWGDSPTRFRRRRS